MMRNPWTVAACVVSLAAWVSGCGGAPDEDSVTPSSEVQGAVHLPVGACTVNFEATVRGGPSTGTSLVGYAVFLADATGALHGSALHTDDGRTVPIQGRVQGA